MLPKKQGGLGFKQLGLWNVASLGQQVWAITQKKDHMWVKWISSLYLRGSDFLTVPHKPSDSWHWRQLLKACDLLVAGLNDPQW